MMTPEDQTGMIWAGIEPTAAAFRTPGIFRKELYRKNRRRRRELGGIRELVVGGGR